ncbi:MAG: biotin--[acetyl-CoA-carboxylase] ligase [Ferruginibacter sp.]|nr:biotin--[acetyl-CoA-carboxylase] ligase [Ferruginibacter sp.]
MKTIEMFTVLDTVDSTNNYAMANVHAGLAKHGAAWFALDQNAGKGQRGKTWISTAGENIIMSIVIEPLPVFWSQPFLFNMVISNICHSFLERYLTNEIKIKWPNDIYSRDRKAGGILIENIFQGSAWKWAVVGIGVNVNQIDFPQGLENATSLKQITGDSYDVIALAKALHKMIIVCMTGIKQATLPDIINTYNDNLYLLNKKVKLRKKNIVFETTVKAVNGHGQLLTQDSMPRLFEFGEVEWIL